MAKKDYFDINEWEKTFVASIIEKLKSRLLVRSSFLHITTCLNPSFLSILGKDVALLRFRQLVQQLSQQKIIECHVGDRNLVVFEQLISKEANIVMFHDYDGCTQRLDSFFFNKLNAQQYESLSNVIKCILVFFMAKVKLNEVLVLTRLL